ncbi:MAG: UDP-N-acetylmuramoyl-L-alanyl-D-glutamate--2,6-diaminopimelate ligase [Alphaproteobacteria bacterium]|nr:UDP-N-acetylmuramoyl-L-alanyl-D-glutamate--2,6-diaminopimelate ligase [Alphaproteobacteria bacterium]
MNRRPKFSGRCWSRAYRVSGLKLTELIGQGAGNRSGRDPEIAGLSANSRNVRPGFLFAALPGTRLDGRNFAADAVDRGAVAILTTTAAGLRLPERAAHVPILTDANPHKRLALLAARFYGRQPLTIVAVTGTNGKTSVVHFTREIWTVLGKPAASLGTLGLSTPGGRRPGALTTPDPVALHGELAALADEGIEHVALEASSHGLDQFRLDGVAVAAAAFTNLTRDHLDYHGDIARYRAAKDRLFTALLTPGATAVLNADCGEFSRLAALCQENGHPVLAYGTRQGADLRLLACRPDARSQLLQLEILGRRCEQSLPLVGEFQAMNALAALGLVIASGGPVDGASAALGQLTGVPGRLQFVAERNGGAIIVDYAHTPDALATVLRALRPHTRGRLVALFGAGGDRDPGKRPLMGAVGARLADQVYITDDNPRSESPAEIRRAVLAAAPGAVEIGDRRLAIEAAIAELTLGDVLVIAGKGHETGQIIGSETYHFDDAEIVREIAGSGAQSSAAGKAE